MLQHQVGDNDYLPKLAQIVCSAAVTTSEVERTFKSRRSTQGGLRISTSNSVAGQLGMYGSILKGKCMQKTSGKVSRGSSVLHLVEKLRDSELSDDVPRVEGMVSLIATDSKAETHFGSYQCELFKGVDVARRSTAKKDVQGLRGVGNGDVEIANFYVASFDM